MSNPLRRQGRCVPSAVLACAAATVLAACAGGSQSANKAGAAIGHRVALRLEMPDAGDPRGTFFAREVARLSGGAVQVRIDASGYSSVEPANELALARALEAGHEDIAYLPARAWASAQVPAFRALLAPFVITTARASQAVAQGQIAKQILETLPTSVVGIALVPDEPRRVLANRPIDSPAAFSGLKIRIIDNPQAAADFLALGARPVPGLDAHAVADALRRGTVDAIESSTASILSNGYFGSARHLSNYAIFAKFQSIVVSRRTWAALSPSQRRAIREAAANTIAAAGRQIPAEERRELTSLCQAHVTLAAPDAAELREFAETAQPAITALASDVATTGTLAALQRLPGTGARPLGSPPAACRQGASAQASAPAKGSATIPNGVYVVTDTVSDWTAGNVVNPDFTTSITFTTRLRNGKWYQTQKPNYPDQGPFVGTYTVRGDQVVFVIHRAGSGADLDTSTGVPETVRWSYFDGQLRFTIVNVADTSSRVIYTAHPWRKIR